MNCFRILGWGDMKKISRRQFIRGAAGTALAAGGASAFVPKKASATAGRLAAAVKLHPFDYQGVRLLDGPLRDRMRATREFYLGIPDDDILKGFRRKAGLPAPGQDMGGWCNDTSAVTFGQWLSGMARLSRATGDAGLRDKAARLMAGWGETLPQQTFGHYDYDKFVCGLVDMAQYAGHPAALPLLARMTDWAEAHLGRARLDATDADSQGGFFNGQMEWYTLPENLYRAYLLTGDARYRDFGDVWRYPHYWGMFNGQVSATPDGFHAYSHVNTLSSAAMTYAVTGDPQYLQTLTGAYDYFQRTQCYATGGYGPGEKLMAPDGALGESLETEPNAKYLGGTVGRSFETPCGTWAVFKLTRYLQQFTGEARYGDWMERVLYNGIGAALPMRGRGETFYYADYRLEGARKYYFGAPWPCCSGTYLQNVADFHNIIYYRDGAGLFVNLYVPSQVTWSQDGQPVTLTQDTRYPEAETTSLTVQMARPAAFSLRVRVPGWAEGASALVNGRAVTSAVRPGRWAAIHRRWHPGDRVTLHIPLHTRLVPVDAQRPRRVAYTRGPVVLVRPQGALPPAPDGADATAGLVPFSQAGEDARYVLYFDPPARDLVATSQRQGALWRWTTSRPAEGWPAPGFDDRAWAEGAAPFGTMDVARTRWDTPDIWLRRDVTLPAGAYADPQLLMFHDEDADVYINGVLASRTTGYNTSYQRFDIAPGARAQMKPGPVTLAVHVLQTTGSQLIDLGLIDTPSAPANHAHRV